MQFIKHIFSSLTPSFLIRNYIFGICFWAACVFLLPDIPIPLIIILTINLLFFPFATLVWDEMCDMLMGGTAVFLPLWTMLIIKFFIKGMIFSFAIPVGVLGILYIWFRTKNAS
ncbi:hypothetical protein [uncultured Helicobacter sp.]|uniref:hypothetical protein n=1 Tax=uncultured Helicobacter sp. TaxID=175537 RepID=UPI00260F9BDC|nr:hypothetical protein [uncultured Helicobacter sp.]